MITTADRAGLPSAKRATLGKELLAKKRSAKAPLPSVFYRALGKAFAEHPARPSAKKSNGL